MMDEIIAKSHTHMGQEFIRNDGTELIGTMMSALVILWLLLVSRMNCWERVPDR